MNKEEKEEQIRKIEGLDEMAPGDLKIAKEVCELCGDFTKCEVYHDRGKKNLKWVIFKKEEDPTISARFYFDPKDIWGRMLVLAAGNQVLYRKVEDVNADIVRHFLTYAISFD